MDTHYNDVIMGSIASQITSLTIVYSTVYSSADQRKHQSSASLAFVRGIHREPVNSPHKWPVTRKMFPFDDVIMSDSATCKCVRVMLKSGHVQGLAIACQIFELQTPGKYIYVDTDTIGILRLPYMSMDLRYLGDHIILLLKTPDFRPKAQYSSPI